MAGTPADSRTVCVCLSELKFGVKGGYCRSEGFVYVRGDLTNSQQKNDTTKHIITLLYYMLHSGMIIILKMVKLTWYTKIGIWYQSKRRTMIHSYISSELHLSRNSNPSIHLRNL